MNTETRYYWDGKNLIKQIKGNEGNSYKIDVANPIPVSNELKAIIEKTDDAMFTEFEEGKDFQLQYEVRYVKELLEGINKWYLINEWEYNSPHAVWDGMDRRIIAIPVAPVEVVEEDKQDVDRIADLIYNAATFGEYTKLAGYLASLEYRINQLENQNHGK